MKVVWNAFLLVALVLVAVPGAAQNCKNCKKDGGHWDCVGGEAEGGTGCSLSGDSCTVSGICGGGGGEEEILFAEIPADLIRDIATFHPRVAASIWNLGKDGRIESPSTISWTGRPISASEVETLLKGEPVRLKGRSAGTIVYRAVVQTGPQGTPELVITPVSPSKLDPQFVALVIPLDPVKPDLSGGYSAKNWLAF